LVALVQAADGSLGNEIFTVTGILPQMGDMVDRNAALLHRADWEELFVARGMVHEVAVNSAGKVPLDVLQAALLPAAGKDEAKTWKDLFPVIAEWSGMIDVMMFYMCLIFGVAAGLGVMNTMLMATHERSREIGVIKALGATPARIVRDISVEAFLLGVAGCALGTVLGVACSYYMEVHGLDLSVFSGESLRVSGMVFDPVYRGKFTAGSVVLSVSLMLGLCVLSALYPAARAASLDPVKAMGRV